MLTDYRSEQIKARDASELGDGIGLDMSANITYGKTEAEKQAMQDGALSENDVSDSDEEMKDEEESRKEYIFLIDRSYSMHSRIKLARLALILFI